MTPSDNSIEIISEPNDFNFIKQWYDLADKNHFWMQWRLKAFINQAKQLHFPLDQPLKGLEVGCGHGVFHEQIESVTPWTVDGAEIDIESLERNTKGRGRLLFYDILEKRAEFENQYDFLFLYDVLEHIEQTSQFIDACHFMLKKNGYLFINVPALQKLFSPYDTAAGHFRRYNTNSLNMELDPAKFNILDTRYWGQCLLPALMVRKALLKNKTNHDDIIRSGFKPPHELINSCFKSLMALETSIFKRPALGTSVMLAAKKI